MARRVLAEECGSTVTLDVYVRRYTKGRETLYLEYEAYQPMALKQMEKLIGRVKEELKIANVGIVHRFGKFEIGSRVW